MYIKNRQIFSNEEEPALELLGESSRYFLWINIRPFPKAGPHLENKGNIQKRKSIIYTDIQKKKS